MGKTEHVLEIALELGFDLAGVAPLEPPPAAERFADWLAAGHHASMGWLERQSERIRNPGRVLPGGRSILVLGMGHARDAVSLPGGGRVARYAAGRDYHNKIGKLLRKLARRLEEAGVLGSRRAIVDAGPLLERSHAAAAGLGFESRAANLLHPRFGPWFFLGELLLEEELEPTPTPPAGSCGTCTACLDACPTAAIRSPGVVDSNRCLSYHTIENRGPIPDAIATRLSDWVFGCDVCSEVCPFGRHAPDASGAFGTHAAVENMSLVDWLRAPRAAFSNIFAGSALQRARCDGLARNAALVLGQRVSEEGRDGLLEALECHPAALVRNAAAWALQHGYGSDRLVRGALERAERGAGDR